MREPVGIILRHPLEKIKSHEKIKLLNYSKMAEQVLPQAILELQVAMISLLIENGADVNQATQQEKTPLDAACGNVLHRKEIMELLIEHGANINIAQAQNLEDYLIIKNFYFANTQIKEPIKNSIALPDDYDSDNDSSSSSESDSDPIPPQKQPNMPGPTHGGGPQNVHPHDDGIFTTTLNRMRAYPLSTFVGVVAMAGGICYWAYKKYQAYKAQKEADCDEQKEDEEIYNEVEFVQ